jgi:hypothetical protein
MMEHYTEEELSKRPLLSIMVNRSNMNWGEAPNYNAEYRRIRWPANSQKVSIERELTTEEMIQREDQVRGRLGTLSFWDNRRTTILEETNRRCTPAWKSVIRHQLERKCRGIWNSTSIRNLHPGFWRYKDTRSNLRVDIRFCMRKNIPFKTKTVEYRPSDTTLYICGRPVVKYSLSQGKIESFSYCGVYEKRVALILRILEIPVMLRNRKLVWAKYHGTTQYYRLIDEERKEEEISINLTDTYVLPINLGMINDLLSHEHSIYRDNLVWVANTTPPPVEQVSGYQVGTT